MQLFFCYAISIMTTPTFYHTVIIGAGASGLFCAGSFDRSKIILEANTVPAKKVSVSGGGKCNFSNRFVSAADYDCQQKHFCKNALAAFTPDDFLRILDEYKIPWHEREHGQLFAEQATDVVDLLVRRAKTHHTTLSLGTRVLDVQPSKEGFLVNTSKGPLQAQHVVLSSGGLSFPDLGGNSFGLKIARQLGLSIVPPRPVLCGLTFPKELRALGSTLAGNSVPVLIRQGKKRFEGPLLFTHDGISGPAVLRLSLFWQPEIPVEIDFLPHQNALDVLAAQKNSSKTVSGALIPALPRQLAKTLLADWDLPLANATREQLRAAAKRINHFAFTPTGTAGYTKAEATAGGIDTREIHPTTLEVRRRPGLFMTGELLDVTGNLGGFNLHWAWASGFAVAQTLSQRF